MQHIESDCCDRFSIELNAYLFRARRISGEIFEGGLPKHGSWSIKLV